jgi:hypothetical protein
LPAACSACSGSIFQCCLLRHWATVVTVDLNQLLKARCHKQAFVIIRSASNVRARERRQQTGTAPDSILPRTCMMIFRRSSGAVTVLPSAPATAPAVKRTSGSGRWLRSAPGLCRASQASEGASPSSGPGTRPVALDIATSNGAPSRLRLLRNTLCWRRVDSLKGA